MLEEEIVASFWGSTSSATRTEMRKMIVNTNNWGREDSSIDSNSFRFNNFFTKIDLLMQLHLLQ
jgi:hypothetical protein